MPPSLDERTNRGNKADRVLNDPMFVEAWDRIEAATLKKWRESNDPLERDRLWHAQDVLAKVKAAFVAHVRDGKAAQKEIDKIADVPRKRVGPF